MFVTLINTGCVKLSETFLINWPLVEPDLFGPVSQALHSTLGQERKSEDRHVRTVNRRGQKSMYYTVDTDRLFLFVV